MSDVSQSQEYFQKEYNHPYLNYLSSFSDLVQNKDSTYVGLFWAIDNNNRNNNIRVAKIDKKGNVLWSKQYKANGFDANAFKIKKFNNDYLIVGEFHVRDSVLRTTKSFVLKINNNGDSLWLKEYKFPSIWTEAINIIQLSDKKILSCGYTVSFKKVGTEYQEQPWRAFIIKTDSLGNIIWQKEYGDDSHSEVPSSMIELPNNDILLAGRSVSGENFDIALMTMRIDTNGNLKWMRSYGSDGINEAFTKISQAKGGKFILSGAYGTPWVSTGNGGIVAKMDENGEMLWLKKFSKETEGLTYDAGHTENKEGYITVAGINHKDNDIGIAQFDSAGIFKWFRRYDIHTKSDEQVNGIIHTLDDGFAMFGHGLSYTRNNDQGWLLKMDKYGCLVKGCEGMIGVDNVPSQKHELVIFPNPSDGVANIKWNLGEQFVKGELKIIDIRGQILHSFQLETASGEYSTNELNLASGIYFVKLHTLQDDLTTKIIISR